MAYPKGKKRPPSSGRKKGSLNKTTKNIKEAIEEVFYRLDGVKGLYDWVEKDDKNKEAFYTKMLIKLLPTTLAGDKENPLIPLDVSVPARESRKEWLRQNAK